MGGEVLPIHVNGSTALTNQAEGDMNTTIITQLGDDLEAEKTVVEAT
jgi:hypothetical protein